MHFIYAQHGHWSLDNMIQYVLMIVMIFFFEIKC